MTARRQWVLLFALAGVCAYAEDTCPALNRARAGAALGGDAQLSVEWHSATEYICNYSAGQNTLRIAVSPYHARAGWPAYTAQCIGKPEPAPGIGNEAVICNSATDGQVLSHVGDTFLDMRLQMPAASQDALRDSLRQLGQRVAGNIF